MRAFFFIGACLFLSACFDKGDCLFTNTTLVKVGLRDATTTANGKQVTFASIHIPDQGILYQDTSMTNFPIVIDPRVNEIEYVFQYNERSDTLLLGYTNQTLVLSPGCGSYLYQDALEIKYSTFGTDRVIIRNRRLLNSVAINIDIFL